MLASRCTTNVNEALTERRSATKNGVKLLDMPQKMCRMKQILLTGVPYVV